MSEQMKDAWKGQGAGLQGAATTVGDVLAGETQSGGQKKATAANESLTEMANGNEKTGPVVGDTPVDAGRQAANQQTGVADHLGMKTAE